MMHAFGILSDYPVSKGHQDTLLFYVGATDTYDTSALFTLKYTVCGQEIVSLNDPVRAIFLYSRNGTTDYEPR